MVAASAPMSEVVEPIQIEGLSFGYGRNELFRGADLLLRQNDRLLLQGRNGCGKTTLVRILLGLISLQGESGLVKVFGKRVRPFSHLAGLGYVGRVTTSGDPSVLPESLTVGELVLLHKHVSRMEDSRWAEGLVKDLNLDNIWEQRPSSLSAGQEKRVQFYLALSKTPALLLCDEAFSNLDVESRPVVEHYIEMLCERQPVAMLWITHEASETFSFITGRATLKEGKILRL